jgi:hypothetical protein
VKTIRPRVFLEFDVDERRLADELEDRVCTDRWSCQLGGDALNIRCIDGSAEEVRDQRGRVALHHQPRGGVVGHRGWHGNDGTEGV